jgi:hypothetical protein
MHLKMDMLSQDVCAIIYGKIIFKKWETISNKIKFLIEILGLGVIMILKLPEKIPELNNGYMKKKYLLKNSRSILPRGLNIIEIKNNYINGVMKSIYKFKINFVNQSDKYVTQYPGGSVIWDNTNTPIISLLTG